MSNQCRRMGRADTCMYQCLADARVFSHFCSHSNAGNFRLLLFITFYCIGIRIPSSYHRVSVLQIRHKTSFGNASVGCGCGLWQQHTISLPSNNIETKQWRKWQASTATTTTRAAAAAVEWRTSSDEWRLKLFDRKTCRFPSRKYYLSKRHTQHTQQNAKNE